MKYANYYGGGRVTKSSVPGVESHWHKLIGNFSTSPKECYSLLEEALRSRAEVLAGDLGRRRPLIAQP